ncbi:hypothetical protein KUV56_03460 [Ferrimonas balearica]|uniref:BsuPI-related putative proteinase inhibitor n=1 Tax=Ferrimonas balearica TaxID=44012 RepID=UPI001C55EBF2|nr:BsuPI-related putative proteinase inhibitor [Ferrimonas balearica]MBW3138585.1 hypothetical protein [Ferrimonas balearica]MBY6105646.1 hypothetical protein [Ferrimonas balearica]
MQAKLMAATAALFLTGLAGCAESSASAAPTAAANTAPAPSVVGGQLKPANGAVYRSSEEQAVQATLEVAERWSRSVGGEIALVLTNTSSSSVQYTIASGMLADFMLSKGKEVVWRYSQEMMFTQALGKLTLAPNETRIVKARVSGNALSRLNPGRYTVSAMVNTHPKDAGPAIAPVMVNLD